MYIDTENEIGPNPESSPVTVEFEGPIESDKVYGAKCCPDDEPYYFADFEDVESAKKFVKESFIANEK